MNIINNINYIYLIIIKITKTISLYSNILIIVLINKNSIIIILGKNLINRFY